MRKISVQRVWFGSSVSVWVIHSGSLWVEMPQFTFSAGTACEVIFGFSSASESSFNRLSSAVLTLPDNSQNYGPDFPGLNWFIIGCRRRRRRFSTIGFRSPLSTENLPAQCHRSLICLLLQPPTNTGHSFSKFGDISGYDPVGCRHQIIPSSPVSVPSPPSNGGSDGAPFTRISHVLNPIPPSTTFFSAIWKQKESPAALAWVLRASTTARSPVPRSQDCVATSRRTETEWADYNNVTNSAIHNPPPHSGCQYTEYKEEWDVQKYPSSQDRIRCTIKNIECINS